MEGKRSGSGIEYGLGLGGANLARSLENDDMDGCIFISAPPVTSHKALKLGCSGGVELSAICKMKIR
jgi:hypothetical protein